MQSIEYRYMHDPLIKALVDSLEHHINALQLTPSEIRECAMLATIRYEQRRPPQGIMVQNWHIRPTVRRFVKPRSGLPKAEERSDDA
ncbi:MAG: hypothetical protein WC449_06020 [Candidatus Paceibacterota bacterium]